MHIVAEIVLVRREAAPGAEDRIRVEPRAAPGRRNEDLWPEIDRQSLHAIVRARRCDLQLAPAPLLAMALPAMPPRLRIICECVALGENRFVLLAKIHRLAVDPDLAGDIGDVTSVHLASDHQHIAIYSSARTQDDVGVDRDDAAS